MSVSLTSLHWDAGCRSSCVDSSQMSSRAASGMTPSYTLRACRIRCIPVLNNCRRRGKCPCWHQYQIRLASRAAACQAAQSRCERARQILQHAANAWIRLSTQLAVCVSPLRCTLDYCNRSCDRDEQECREAVGTTVLGSSERGVERGPERSERRESGVKGEQIQANGALRCAQ